MGTMCPSTCASSVETWLRPYTHLRAPSPARARSATPMSANATRRRPPVWGTGPGAALPEAAGDAAGASFVASRFVSGSIVVAIDSLKSGSGLVEGVRDPGRPGQRDATRRRREAGIGVGVPRANQGRLRVNHVEVAGHSRPQTLACLREFVQR